MPLLGIPGSWRNTLVFLSGIFLILVALGPVILKKLQPKQKRKKEITHPDFVSTSLTTREGEPNAELTQEKE